MTIALTFLRTLSLFDWVLIAGASWAIVSVSVATPIGRAMARADRQPEPETDADWLPEWINGAPDDLADAPEFDPLRWVADDDTVASLINEMEADFR